jgi:hypothetical protein
MDPQIGRQYPMKGDGRILSLLLDSPILETID